MALYESIIILDSLLTPEEINKIADRVKELIEGDQGKIVKIDKWGKRRLAYEIQKKQYGFYISFVFDGKNSTPIVLENEYNYNDKILRYLIYRFDKNKLKDWERQKELGDKKPPKDEDEIPVAEEIPVIDEIKESDIESEVEDEK